MTILWAIFCCSSRTYANPSSGSKISVVQIGAAFHACCTLVLPWESRNRWPITLLCVLRVPSGRVFVCSRTSSAEYAAPVTPSVRCRDYRYLRAGHGQKLLLLHPGGQ